MDVMEACVFHEWRLSSSSWAGLAIIIIHRGFR